MSSVVVSGVERELGADPTTGFDLFPDRAIVALKVNGQLKDKAYAVQAGEHIEAVTLESADGLNILRHSTAHVLAQAVQQLRADAKLGIGPFIEDGFYYDFDVAEPFTPDDLKDLQKRMQKIINKKQRFVRRPISESDALAEESNEPYKIELIGLKGHDTDSEASVEVSHGELTMYDNVDMQTGETVWKDLCRGPHLPDTGYIGNGFALLRVAAAYWRGNENNKQLQRIYGTAWPSKTQLREYQQRLEEAAKRDHRKLGKELDLFSFPDEIGSGLAVFHPKGGIIRYEIEQYMREQLLSHDYCMVNTPHITKSDLFRTSGHLQTYADGMFPPMHLDEETDADGNITKQGQDYYLKPMNCPFHNLIYKSRGRSYKELPLRLAEFGTVYRYEKSGTLQGLTRVRGLTQDDAHIYVAQDQVRAELTRNLEFVLQVLRDYGLNDFYLELSTKEDGNPKFLGDDQAWTDATETLREIALASGLELVADPGGAAFYGPKISVQARDAIGRTWQMSTIQLDFNQPERFELEYTAADGSHKRPVMIHRALFGSIERFFAILLEHYAGAFPVWLAPEQVEGVPVADEYNEYLEGVAAQMKSAGIRVSVDVSDDRMPKKIRNWSKQKVPFIMIAGEEDRDANAVSFRFRDGSQRNGIPIAEAIEIVRNAIAERRQVMTSDDI